MCEIGISFSLDLGGGGGQGGLNNLMKISLVTGPGHFFTGPTTFPLAPGQLLRSQTANVIFVAIICKVRKKFLDNLELQLPFWSKCVEH